MANCGLGPLSIWRLSVSSGYGPVNELLNALPSAISLLIKRGSAFLLVFFFTSSFYTFPWTPPIYTYFKTYFSGTY